MAIGLNNKQAILELYDYYHNSNDLDDSDDLDDKIKNLLLIGVNMKDPEITIRLAYFYQDNHIHDEAVKYYLLAIEFGSIDAYSELGGNYRNRNDYENMIKYYSLGITKMCVTCAYKLGLYYISTNEMLTEKYFKIFITYINQRDHDDFDISDMHDTIQEVYNFLILHYYNTHNPEEMFKYAHMSEKHFYSMDSNILETLVKYYLSINELDKIKTMYEKNHESLYDNDEDEDEFINVILKIMSPLVTNEYYVKATELCNIIKDYKLDCIVFYLYYKQLCIDDVTFEHVIKMFDNIHRFFVSL